MMEDFIMTEYNEILFEIQQGQSAFTSFAGAAENPALLAPVGAPVSVEMQEVGTAPLIQVEGNGGGNGGSYS